MTLGIHALLNEVKTRKLVEGLCTRELENPEGAGFDLRLGGVYEFTGEGEAFLGIDERQTPEIKEIVSYDKEQVKTITFEPGKYYLVSTIEKVNMPLDLCAGVKPRTTLFRSGLFLRTGSVAPGYSGILTFALVNEGPIPVTMELGCRFSHIQFQRLEGEGSQYRGQWQGGRVSAEEREKQV